jgi:hypothetical protein
MNENAVDAQPIINRLSMRIAQLEVDKAVLQTEMEELRSNAQALADRLVAIEE